MRYSHVAETWFLGAGEAILKKSKTIFSNHIGFQLPI